MKKGQILKPVQTDSQFNDKENNNQTRRIKHVNETKNSNQIGFNGIDIRDGSVPYKIHSY